MTTEHISNTVSFVQSREISDREMALQKQFTDLLNCDVLKHLGLYAVITPSRRRQEIGVDDKPVIKIFYQGDVIVVFSADERSIRERLLVDGKMTEGMPLNEREIIVVMRQSQKSYREKQG